MRLMWGWRHWLQSLSRDCWGRQSNLVVNIQPGQKQVTEWVWWWWWLILFWSCWSESNNPVPQLLKVHFLFVHAFFWRFKVSKVNAKINGKKQSYIVLLTANSGGIVVGWRPRPHARVCRLYDHISLTSGCTSTPHWHVFYAAKSVNDTWKRFGP